MRRLVVLITALAALAFAPSAGAFVQNSFFNGGSVTGSGTFGGNSFTLFINQNPIFGGLNGIVSFGGTDANGTHSFGARVTCLGLSSDGANATILGEIISVPAPVGEPANLAGVLVHATDPEAAGATSGAGDKLDVTFLNAKQIQRQEAVGCPAAAAKRAITSGNVVDIIDVLNIAV